MYQYSVRRNEVTLNIERYNSRLATSSAEKSTNFIASGTERVGCLIKAWTALLTLSELAELFFNMLGESPIDLVAIGGDGPSLRKKGHGRR